MGLKNTSNNYGSIAKLLHWLTALLFLISYISVYYRHWFTEAKTDANMLALHMHLSVGVSIGVLVLLRIIWRNISPPPAQEPGSRLEHLAAHMGHYALYAIMIIAPLTGYLGTGVDTKFFYLFDIPRFEDTALFQWMLSVWPSLDFKTFEKPIDFIHKDILGAWIVWMLIVGHVAAALFHHFKKGDRTLTKMTTGR